jgi:hypothetical protein
MHHPRVLFNPGSLEDLRRHVETLDWARILWKQEQAQVDDILSLPIDLPPRGGNWMHRYASPVSGERLVCGKRIGPWQ